MAATKTALDAAIIANRLANKPALVDRNYVQLVTTLSTDLRTNTDGRISVADASAANRDRKFLIDRFRHTWWEGNAAATAWYVIADLVAAGSNPFSSLILDHDGVALNGCTLNVYGDDTTTPPVGGGGGWAGAELIFGPIVLGSAQVVVALHATHEYSPRWVRIELTKGAPFTPKIRQAWLGRVVQLPNKSNYGSEPAEARASSTIEQETSTGILWDYQTKRMKRARQQTFTFAERPKDGVTLLALADAWENPNSLDGGANALWYIEDPTAAPASAIFVKPREGSKEFKPIQREEFVTDWKFIYREQGGV